MAIDKGLLARWMRRRTAVRDAEKASGEAEPATAEMELTRLALKKIFSMAGIAAPDRMNEYDGDYTGFKPLGGIVTREMRKAAERLAQAERRREEGEDRIDGGRAGEAEGDDGKSA
ncbi:MAG: hypothetical protein ACU833_06960 [Gammaproteobacteria bacterium]